MINERILVRIVSMAVLIVSLSIAAAALAQVLTYVTNHFVIYVNTTPTTYTINDLMNALEHSYNWYVKHGLKLAPPCNYQETQGKILVIVGSSRSYWGFVFQDPISRCVRFIFINATIGDYLSGVFYMNQTVAHELFHLVECYYTRYPFVYTDIRYRWIYESAATAASYLVYPIWKYCVGSQCYPSFLKASTQMFFNQELYRKDPARMCRESYLYCYYYAPLFYLIFNWTLPSLNYTLSNIFGSPFPNNGLWIRWYLADAYAALAYGFPLEPSLRPKYTYIVNGSVLTLEPRTAVYLTYSGSSLKEEWTVIQYLGSGSVYIGPSNFAFRLYGVYGGEITPLFYIEGTNMYVAEGISSLQSGNRFVLTVLPAYGGYLPPGVNATISIQFKIPKPTLAYRAKVSPRIVEVVPQENGSLKVILSPCIGIVAASLNLTTTNAVWSWYSWNNSMPALQVKTTVPAPNTSFDWNFAEWTESQSRLTPPVANLYYSIVLYKPSTAYKCSLVILDYNTTSTGKAHVNIDKLVLVDQRGQVLSVALRENATVYVENISSTKHVSENSSTKLTIMFDKTRYEYRNVGDLVRTALMLLNGSNIAGVTVAVRFNPKVVRVVNVTGGDFVKRVGGMMMLNINNTAGFVKIAIAGTRPCKANKTIIAYITFRTISLGKTQLDIVQAVASNVNGSIVIPRTINSEITLMVTAAPVPKVVKLIVNKTAIVNVTVSPGYLVAGANIYIVIRNASVARVTSWQAGDLRTIQCKSIVIGDRQVLHCAAASATTCNKPICVVVRLKVTALHQGTTEIEPINGTISNKEGELFDITDYRTAIVKVYAYPECDLNKNFRIDIGDAVLCLRAVVGLYKPDVPCDLNKNGRTCDIGDCVLILRKIVGLA